MMLSVLHISDLHRDPANPIGNQVLLDSLERDRDRYTLKEDPRVEPPSLIVVTGDIVQGVKHGAKAAEATLQRQYEEALAFLGPLTDRFVDGDKRRVIVVPGNHDVSDHHFRESLTPMDLAAGTKKDLMAGLFKPGSPLRWSWEEFALFKVEDWNIYHQRLAAFGDFYSRFYEGNRSYSTDPDKQIDVFDLPDLGVAIVGFCSCYNNDLLNRQGAIHPDCIAAAGKRLREITASYDPLRIAVWHHNTEGPPSEVDYMDPDIVQNLIDGGFSLGLHGHQHRPQFIDTRFRHGPNRRITVISAGTLCGGAAFRYGRAYNVIEINVQDRTGRLHLREMQNDNLQMPIWGARPLPPNNASSLEFTFDPPPEPFVKPDRNTLLLRQAQEFYERGQHRRAVNVLLPIARSVPLARRLLLECFVRIDAGPEIIGMFDPPESAAEAIALMDALWAEANKKRLAEVLAMEPIAGSADQSVIEIRNKYATRLKK